MKNYEYYITQRPSLSNHLELETHIVVENLIDDILCLDIIFGNKLVEMVVLHPFQKETISIPHCFREETVTVLDDDEVIWHLLEYQEFRICSI
ncbi:competence protein ComA [Streptococcus suis]|uniref:competence protein ComA n=1 Tax=Streptococcus suis TaxID=1307 RepID=UPI003706C470